MAKFDDIVAINVNSLVGSNRRQLFLNFVDDVRADVYFLSETHFNANSHITLNGYNCFKQIRASNGGGTAILLNEKIRFRNLMTINKGIEATVIDAFLNNQWIRLISIYIPPGINKLNQSIFKKLFTTSTPFICGGDFNARMLLAGDISNNSMGIFINNFIQNNDISPIFPKSPTCFRSSNGSFIDFFLTSTTLNISSDIITTHPSFSDHLAIKLNLEFNNDNNLTNNTTTLYSYSYTNINKLNHYISTELKKLNNK